MKQRIVFNPLPERPRPLGEREVRNVFGGCGTSFDSCSDDCDCCDFYACCLLAPATGQRYCEKISQ